MAIAPPAGWQEAIRFFSQISRVTRAQIDSIATAGLLNLNTQYIIDGQYSGIAITGSVYSTIELTPYSPSTDTRPRYGVAAAIPATTAATIFAALTPAGSNASRVIGSSISPVSVNPGAGQHGWIAVLASAASSGLIFNTELGHEGWNGATSAGQNTAASPIPSTASVSYTDGTGNVWSLFRQDYFAAPISFWTN